MMKERIRVGHLAIASVVVAALWTSTACNALLGNEERDADAGVIDVESDASPTCPLGQHYCSAINSCGPSDDPAFGCGGSTCEPCAVANGQAKCGGNGCVIDTCDPGFIVCNGACTDISTIASCGSCGGACQPGELCAPTLQAPPAKPYACVVSCGAGLTQCGSQCVDTTSTAAHCGSCTTRCPPAANGTATCADSKCTLDCDPKYRKCPGDATTCVRQDVVHCGADCAPCAAPALGTAQCTSSNGVYACTTTCPNDSSGGKKYEVCGTTCVDVNTDPKNCGGCGSTCTSPTGGTCTCSSGHCGLCPLP